MKVLVTGAPALSGNALCAHSDWPWGFVVGRSLEASGRWSDAVVVGDIGADTDRSTALEGVDQVVHLAARAIDSDSSSLSPPSTVA